MAVRTWCSIAVVVCLVGVGASDLQAEPVNVTFADGLNYYHAYRCWCGGPLEGWCNIGGEWTVTVGSSPAVPGYRNNCSSGTFTDGSVQALSTKQGAYAAAWLMDQYSLGLGNDGHPPGYSGYTTTERCAGLAVAVFEVVLSPPTDPLNLSADYFQVTYGPLPPRTLGQAYLDELATASLNNAYLDAHYAILQDSGTTTWLVISTGVSEPGLIPEPAALGLLGLATLVVKRKRRV